MIKIEKNITSVLYGRVNFKVIYSTLDKIQLNHNKNIFSIYEELRKKIQNYLTYEQMAIYVSNLDIFYKNALKRLNDLNYFYSEEEKNWFIRRLVNLSN